MIRTSEGRLRVIDALPAIFIIVLSLGILIGTAGLPYWAGTTPGSRFLPVWLSGSGVLLGLLMILSQVMHADKGILDLPSATGAARVGMTIAAMATLTLATPLVGMVPMLGLFMAFMLIVVLRQRAVSSLITTAIVVGFIHIIFVRWLLVPLPAPFGF